ncbi:MAG: hypothetical protein KDB88_10070 [Flavobacteriales bacterium]|nr:hypothetical protein [Flavobacteriales bacterium]
MARRTFDRLFWTLLGMFGGLMPVIYFQWLMPSDPTGIDASLFERGISSPLLMWVNGYLGTFFNYRYVGVVAWMGIPILVSGLARWSDLNKVERGLSLCILLSVSIIGGMGGFNYRYAYTLFPLIIIMVFVSLHKAFDHFGYSRRERMIMLSSIVALNTLCLVMAMDHRIRVKQHDPTFRSPDTSSGPLGERLNTAPDDLDAWFGSLGIAEDDRFLVNNLPVFYYRSDHYGTYYWAGSDQLYQANGTAFLFKDRTNEQVQAFLIDSLNITYVLSTRELTAYSDRFEEFLERSCTLIGEEKRGHTVHAIHPIISE